jgi:hypothetical protein
MIDIVIVNRDFMPLERQMKNDCCTSHSLPGVTVQEYG